MNGGASRPLTPLPPVGPRGPLGPLTAEALRDEINQTPTLKEHVTGPLPRAGEKGNERTRFLIDRARQLAALRQEGWQPVAQRIIEAPDPDCYLIVDLLRRRLPVPAAQRPSDPDRRGGRR